MDGDLQHDPSILPTMVDILRVGTADVVVASRYLSTERAIVWSPARHVLSRLATVVANQITRRDLTDPVSGYFAAKRDIVERTAACSSGQGFKILFEVLWFSRQRNIRVKEIGYSFAPRASGTSKLDVRALHDLLFSILHCLMGRWLPAWFVMFALVGGLGVLVHFLALVVLTNYMQLSTSQAIASLVAMTKNFAINNLLTYRDVRLRGFSWLYGWLTFSTICSVGLFANVGIAAMLFEDQAVWYLSALAGIIIGGVWNYSVTSFYTWR